MNLKHREPHLAMRWSEAPAVPNHETSYSFVPATL